MCVWERSCEQLWPDLASDDANLSMRGDGVIQCSWQMSSAF
jgi:hypothetical protein